MFHNDLEDLANPFNPLFYDAPNDNNVQVTTTSEIMRPTDDATNQSSEQQVELQPSTPEPSLFQPLSFLHYPITLFSSAQPIPVENIHYQENTLANLTPTPVQTENTEKEQTTSTDWSNPNRKHYHHKTLRENEMDAVVRLLQSDVDESKLHPAIKKIKELTMLVFFSKCDEKTYIYRDTLDRVEEKDLVQVSEASNKVNNRKVTKLASYVYKNNYFYSDTLESTEVVAVPYDLRASIKRNSKKELICQGREIVRFNYDYYSHGNTKIQVENGNIITQDAIYKRSYVDASGRALTRKEKRRAYFNADFDLVLDGKVYHHQKKSSSRHSRGPASTPALFSPSLAALIKGKEITVGNGITISLRSFLNRKYIHESGELLSENEKPQAKVDTNPQRKNFDLIYDNKRYVYTRKDNVAQKNPVEQPSSPSLYPPTVRTLFNPSSSNQPSKKRDGTPLVADGPKRLRKQ